MKIDLKNQQGEVVQQLDLTAKLWSIKPHTAAMFAILTSQQQNAAHRYGKHQAKTRGMVRGGGRKPWKQKGTGNARQGSIRSPQWKGGGVVFGPHITKNYTKKVNKKVHRLGLKSLLAEKVQTNEMLILNELKLTKISTNDFYNILVKLNIVNRKILLILPAVDEKVMLSAKNIKNVKVLIVNNLNPLALADNNLIITTKLAISKIEELY